MQAHITESEPRSAPCTSPSAGARVYFASPRRPGRSAQVAQALRPGLDRDLPAYLTHTEDSDLGITRPTPVPQQGRPGRALGGGVRRHHRPRRLRPLGASARHQDKPLWLAAQGFPGIAAILPVLLSGPSQAEAAAAADLPAARRRAARYSTSSRPGNIAPGYDADFTVVDLGKERKFVPAELGSYADYSLYKPGLKAGRFAPSCGA
jgi:hypothetical protein